MDDILAPKDENGLPATYQAPMKGRLKPLLWVVPFYLFAMMGRVHLNSQSPIWLWIFAVILFLSLVFSFLSAGFCKITLYPDRIERKTWLGRKTMKKSDVGKVRKRAYGLSMLCYKYNERDGIVIPKGIGGDEVWNRWMAGVERTSAEEH